MESALAWEPLTPRGVAAFAHARLSRLLLVQFIVASLVAIAFVRFLANDCFPTVRAAIQHLPATGEIRGGRLNFPEAAPQRLAAGHFLGVMVDFNHTGQLHSSADVQIEFGRESVRIISLLGYAEQDYPRDWRVSFNRTDLEPPWGAWEPEWLAIAVPATVIGLMLSWAVLAAIYLLPAWLAAFFMNRALDFRASWKLAGAALMPGALLMAAAIVLYDLAALDFVQFSFLLAAHLVLGWIYLFLSQFFLPRTESAPDPGNPFDALW